MKKTKKVFMLLFLLFCCSLAAAYDSTGNMDIKWRYTLPSQGGSFALADLDGDGSKEIIAGLYDNTLLVLNSKGNLKQNFSLGNESKLGRIYTLEAADLNGDGKAELVVGFGGLKVTENFNLYGFTVTNATGSGTGSIDWQSKVLYRTIRYMGSVQYLSPEGRQIWKKQAYNSVLDIHLGDANGDGAVDILAGVGDYGLDVYSEYAMVNYTNETCTEEEVEDEYTGYDQEQCNCDGCYWNSTSEECLRSYIKRTCETTITQVPGRVLVEYPIKNGSAYVYTTDGRLLWGKHPQRYNKSSNTVEADADNNVRVVYTADVNLDGKNDILAGLDSGVLYVYNWSGLELESYETTSGLVGGVSAVCVSSFGEKNARYVIVGTDNGVLGFFDQKSEKPKWVTRLSKSVEVIKVFDIESDGREEVVVGSVDGKIYVYDKDGVNEWYYPTGSAIYYLDAFDVEGDGYMDLVVGSLSNVTLYGMNVEYVLRQSAESFYAKAEEYFSIADYTVSMIYVTKAKDLYLKIKDPEGITKCDIVIKKISDEFKSRKKFEADTEFDRAMAAYARNDLKNSLIFLQAARSIYVEISNAEGIKKCDTLKEEIDRFMIDEKNLAAEAHYAKALNYLSFGNYTMALSEARAAKAIYSEIGYYNGTVTSNKVVNNIADAYYFDSQRQMPLRRFNESLFYAEMALELYNESKNYDGTAKTELLIQEIKKKIVEEPVETTKVDYKIIVYAAVGFVLLLALFARIRGKSSGEEFKTQISAVKTDF
ncbi:MAG: hypothetical protein FJY77_01395 [Candidatus Altiarchaeales archaeon]|nr:hypothetical protein [Candidatus Altiarchaeales archaeon]